MFGVLVEISVSLPPLIEYLIVPETAILIRNRIQLVLAATELSVLVQVWARQV